MTVLVATHNGAATLPLVLAAYRALEPPPGGWRLVLVENACTDRTGDVIRAGTDGLPLRHLAIPERGQNRARNRGLEELAGDLLVLTDDDAVPAPDWLVRLRAAADAHPDFGIFGGRVLPRWETPPPAWLLEEIPLAPCYAVTDPEWTDGPIKSDFVFSPNMALRADVLGNRRFDESIGPRAGAYPMGSETELTRRLAADGVRAWHVREAVVEHLVRRFQITPEWLLRRAYRYGRGQGRWPALERRGAEAPSGGRRLAAAWRAAKGIAGTTARAARARVRGRAAEALHWRWQRARLLGVFAESVAGRPSPRRQAQ
jgi:glycosyltransferase involved in cell wall biosynthesis